MKVTYGAQCLHQFRVRVSNLHVRGNNISFFMFCALLFAHFFTPQLQTLKGFSHYISKIFSNPIFIPNYRCHS